MGGGGGEDRHVPLPLEDQTKRKLSAYQRILSPSLDPAPFVRILLNTKTTLLNLKLLVVALVT